MFCGDLLKILIFAKHSDQAEKNKKENSINTRKCSKLVFCNSRKIRDTHVGVSFKQKFPAYLTKRVESSSSPMHFLILSCNRQIDRILFENMLQYFYQFFITLRKSKIKKKFKTNIFVNGVYLVHCEKNSTCLKFLTVCWIISLIKALVELVGFLKNLG